MAHFSWIALTLLTAILTRAASTEATADNIMNSRRRNHSSLAHRLIPREEAQVLSKRSTPGRGTFYNIGQGDMGACGGSLDPNGFFVALNRPQYGDINSKSGNCGKTIVISHGGKSAHAVVLDACPECAYGALDLSPKLFQFFASKDVGVLDLTWTFEDDNHDAAAAAKKVAEDNAARKAAEVETKKRAKEDMQKAKEDKQKAKADEEAAKKKEEEDKKRIKEEAEAEAKRIADKKAADDKKKEAAAENAKLKAIEDQKAKNAAAAAEEEKKSKDQRPTQPSSTPSKEEKVVVIKQQKKERKPTTNIASFSELVRGYDRIVQDGHAHLMRWIEPSCI